MGTRGLLKNKASKYEICVFRVLVNNDLWSRHVCVPFKNILFCTFLKKKKISNKSRMPLWDKFCRDAAPQAVCSVEFMGKGVCQERRWGGISGVGRCSLKPLLILLSKHTRLKKNRGCNSHLTWKGFAYDLDSSPFNSVARHRQQCSLLLKFYRNCGGMLPLWVLKQDKTPES